LRLEVVEREPPTVMFLAVSGRSAAVHGTFRH